MYYSVIILTRVRDADNRYKYTPRTVYFGESERIMKTKFYEAVKKAQTMPTSESVVVWIDGKQTMRAIIEH